MRVLVTGGAGYIGSVTVRHLLDYGYAVNVLDSLVTGNRDLVDPQAAFYEGDIRDELSVFAASERCDAVIHCAGLSVVSDSQENPSRYFDANVTAPLGMLSVLISRGIRKVVFSSSAAVYGNADGVISEQNRLRPVNAYGATKAAFESVLKGYEAADRLRAVCLRYFNAAGATLDASVGERHRPETHIIPRVLSGEPFTLYGDDYPTRDGTCVRDYVHVLDIAEAHRLSLVALEDGLKFGIFNLGSGRGYTNLEVVSACASAMGRDIEYEVVDRRPGDPPSLIAGHAFAKAILGWEPTFGLDEMVAHAWAWHQADSSR